MDFSQDTLSNISAAIQLLLVGLAVGALGLFKSRINSFVIALFGYMFFMSTGTLIRINFVTIEDIHLARLAYYFTLTLVATMMSLVIVRLHRVFGMGIEPIANITVSLLLCYALLFLVRYVDRYTLGLLDGVYPVMVVMANLCMAVLFVYSLIKQLLVEHNMKGSK